MPTIYKPLLLDAADKGLLAYVESNYDHEQLRELIWDVQELYLPSVLGTALYEELKTQVRTNALTSANQTLLYTYIQPAMKWKVMGEGAPIFTYKFRNKGIVTQSSDNATPATMGDIQWIVTYCEQRYQMYAQRITNYLIENDATYPLFTDAGDGVDTIHPNFDQYNVGWYMPKSGQPYGEYNPCAKGGENSVDL